MHRYETKKEKKKSRQKTGNFDFLCPLEPMEGRVLPSIVACLKALQGPSESLL
jgi:hypothetical protein